MKNKIQNLLITLAILAGINHVAAQGTAFTYQGRLNSGNQPANGIYDFRFRLAGDSLANNYVGNPFLINAMSMSNGLFSTTVDFGASVFHGSNYWLEVDVRTNGAGNYTVLAPMQAVTPTPYAIFANSASNLLGALPASQLSGAVVSAAGFTGNLSGDVTGTQGATVVASVGGQSAENVAGAVTTVYSATSADTAYSIVQRDANGSFIAGSIALANNLNLPTTTASSGIINSGGSPFIHDYGNRNIFAGIASGNFTTSGIDNAGFGYYTLNGITSGQQNVGMGSQALGYNTSGNGNTAIGFLSLGNFTSGQNNIALGAGAGLSITTGNNNIFIGNNGSDGDSGVIRIGTSGTHQSASIAGIYNHAAASGAAVYVVSSGQLGTLPSSAKFKQDIQSMGDASDALLALKPVTFQYKPEIDPEGIPQFGLVAEDVEKVNPALVVHDAEHGIYTVRYQAVDAMLLNEFLKEHRKVENQNTKIEQLQQTVQQLKGMVNKLASIQKQTEEK